MVVGSATEWASLKVRLLDTLLELQTVERWADKSGLELVASKALSWVARWAGDWGNAWVASTGSGTVYGLAASSDRSKVDWMVNSQVFRRVGTSANEMAGRWADWKGVYWVVGKVSQSEEQKVDQSEYALVAC